MSNLVTSACRPLVLPPTQKAVLMCLADFCHDDGRDWHSIAAIMAWTCLGKTTVIDALKGLEAQGLIAIERAIGRKSTTTLQLEKIAATAPAEDEARSRTRNATRTGTGAAPVREAVPTGAPPVSTGAPPAQTGAPPAPEALEASKASRKHHQRARALEVSPSIPDGDLPNEIPAGAWREYIAYRDAIGYPMPLPAQNAAITELRQFHSLGHDVAAVIARTMICGLRGFVPPDAEAAKQEYFARRTRQRREFYGPAAAKVPGAAPLQMIAPWDSDVEAGGAIDG